MIIFVTGESKSGKTRFSKLIEEEYGFERISYLGYLFDLCKDVYQTLTKEDILTKPYEEIKNIKVFCDYQDLEKISQPYGIYTQLKYNGFDKKQQYTIENLLKKIIYSYYTYNMKTGMFATILKGHNNRNIVVDDIYALDEALKYSYRTFTFYLRNFNNISPENSEYEDSYSKLIDYYFFCNFSERNVEYIKSFIENTIFPMSYGISVNTKIPIVLSNKKDWVKNLKFDNLFIPSEPEQKYLLGVLSSLVPTKLSVVNGTTRLEYHKISVKHALALVRLFGNDNIILEKTNGFNVYIVNQLVISVMKKYGIPTSLDKEWLYKNPNKLFVKDMKHYQYKYFIKGQIANNSFNGDALQFTNVPISFFKYMKLFLGLEKSDFVMTRTNCKKYHINFIILPDTTTKVKKTIGS